MGIVSRVLFLVQVEKEGDPSFRLSVSSEQPVMPEQTSIQRQKIRENSFFLIILVNFELWLLNAVL